MRRFGGICTVPLKEEKKLSPLETADQLDKMTEKCSLSEFLGSLLFSEILSFANRRVEDRELFESHKDTRVQDLPVTLKDLLNNYSVMANIDKILRVLECCKLLKVDRGEDNNEGPSYMCIYCLLRVSIEVTSEARRPKSFFLLKSEALISRFWNELQFICLHTLEIFRDTPAGIDCNIIKLSNKKSWLAIGSRLTFAQRSKLKMELVGKEIPSEQRQEELSSQFGVPLETVTKYYSSAVERMKRRLESLNDPAKKIRVKGPRKRNPAEASEWTYMEDSVLLKCTAYISAKLHESTLQIVKMEIISDVLRDIVPTDRHKTSSMCGSRISKFSNSSHKKRIIQSLIHEFRIMDEVMHVRKGHFEEDLRKALSLEMHSFHYSPGNIRKPFPKDLLHFNAMYNVRLHSEAASSIKKPLVGNRACVLGTLKLILFSKGNSYQSQSSFNILKVFEPALIEEAFKSMLKAGILQKTSKSASESFLLVEGRMYLASSSAFTFVPSYSLPKSLKTDCSALWDRGKRVHLCL